MAIERKGEIRCCLPLEILPRPVIFPSCRFTNSIAKSASATAKSSSAPAPGREPPARTAGQRNYPRNFPSLPPPAPAAGMTRRCVRTAAEVAAADIVTDIKFVWEGRRVADPKFKFRDGDTPSLPQFPAPSPASDLPPPNQVSAFVIRPASLRRWPRPALSRR